MRRHLHPGAYSGPCRLPGLRLRVPERVIVEVDQLVRRNQLEGRFYEGIVARVWTPGSPIVAMVERQAYPPAAYGPRQLAGHITAKRSSADAWPSGLRLVITHDPFPLPPHQQRVDTVDEGLEAGIRTLGELTFVADIMDPAMPVERIQQLVAGAAEGERLAALLNPSCPPELLFAAVCGADRRARDAAWRNPACPEEARVWAALAHPQGFPPF